MQCPGYQHENPTGMTCCGEFAAGGGVRRSMALGPWIRFRCSSGRTG
jgi:hypothetical protein